MVSFRGLVAVPIILVCGLLADATAQSNAGSSPTDPRAVLDRVRDTYRNLPSYHFDRLLLVQEARSEGKLPNIAELTLTLATESGKPGPDGKPFPLLNLDRFRLRTRTKQGEMLQVCGGGTCWSYTSLKNEYMRGNSVRDVNTSVGGSMMLALHLFTVSTLEEGVIQEAKVVREEDVEVGKERRRCSVIEGEIQTTLPSKWSPKPPTPAALGVSWLVSLLTLQGLAGERGATMYSPLPPDQKEVGAGEPTRVTLWVDKNAHMIVRSKMAAQLYKRALKKGDQAVEKVAVVVTDSFTTAGLGAPPDDVFRFTPPEGATEVPNAASRREKKN